MKGNESTVNYDVKHNPLVAKYVCCIMQDEYNWNYTENQFNACVVRKLFEIPKKFEHLSSIWLYFSSPLTVSIWHY